MMKNWSPVRIYFTILSIVGIVGSIIAGGASVYTLIDKALITDEEYLVGGNRSYEYTQCDLPTYKAEVQVDRTAEEIATCKTEARERVLVARSYEFKSDLIMGIVRFAIFATVYGFHYSRLKSFRNENEID